MALTRKRFNASAGALVAAAFVPGSARAAEDLRVAFIPEVATTATSYSEKQPLVDVLQRATGRRVRLFIPTNYAATVEALGNETVDLAYLGGLTYLKAAQRYGVRPLVQRLEDRRFHSLFITNPKASISALKELKGRTFAFGDINSTSGHLMPAKEFYDVGIDPEKDLHYRYTGNHTATALAVSSEQVDAGAMDETVYHKLVSDKALDPAKARVFYTSKPFVDYVWAVRKDLDIDTSGDIRRAFLHLRDRKVLDLLRATYYVTVNDRAYDTLRETAKKLALL